MIRRGSLSPTQKHVTRTANTQRLIVEDSAAGRRFDPRAEAAAYFCVAEATRDLGDPVLVVLAADDEHLRVIVSGSDHGDLPLGHIRDRLEAAGGSMSVSANDRHTVIEAQLPAPQPMVAAF